MRRLVIFDIDGTLVPGASSEMRFARYLWRQGALGWRQLLAYAWFCLRYLPRYGRHVLEKNKAYLSGHRQADIMVYARAFVDAQLVPALYAPAVERLRAHQAAGDHVVLLSGTPEFLASALADAVGANDSLGALCATDNACFTTQPPRRHPYGPTKIEAAQALATAAGLPLEQAIAFGDSVNDAFLFRAVGEVVMVQPDPRLSAIADGTGWKLLFDRPDASH